MIKHLNKNERTQISCLFNGWEETLIWSYLHGEMGEAWVGTKNEVAETIAAQIVVGDFFFFAGDASAPEARELVLHIPENFQSAAALLLPQNESWRRLILEQYGEKICQQTRYAIKKEGDIFDRELLRTFASSLPSGFTIRPFDAQTIALAKKEDWSDDFCSQFNSAEDFLHRGLGFAAFYHEELVAGVSSYTVYHGGIEIEIDTKKDFRRRGLALACAASLILECLERGLYPSWDAANLSSVALSEKLGYHFSHEYPSMVLCKEHFSRKVQ